MNSRDIWLLCAGVVAVAILGLPRKAEEKASPAPPAAVTERVEKPTPTPIHADVAPAESVATTAPEPLAAPEISPELRGLLTRLRGTFEGRGSKPNRFRLQRQLSELWGDHPPVDVLLFEASDPEAPSKYRAHFAARLRNLGKTAPPEQREELAHAMRESLARQPQGNFQLAQALLAFDQQPANVRAVSAPLESPLPDDTTAGLLAALALSGSTESRHIRLEHTRSISSDPDRFPLALQASLPPLALRPELEVGPILHHVLSNTSHFPLYETAVESCFYRPPGSATLAALQVAVARRTEFDVDEQERLTQRIRAGLLRHSRQVATSQPSIHEGIETLLSQLQ